MLDELEQQQLFTSSEDDGETFGYHEVLRTHLEWALVEEYGAAGARQGIRAAPPCSNPSAISGPRSAPMPEPRTGGPSPG